MSIDLSPFKYVLSTSKAKHQIRTFQNRNHNGRIHIRQESSKFLVSAPNPILLKKLRRQQYFLLLSLKKNPIHHSSPPFTSKQSFLTDEACNRKSSFKSVFSTQINLRKSDVSAPPFYFLKKQAFSNGRRLFTEKGLKNFNFEPKSNDPEKGRKYPTGKSHNEFSKSSEKERKKKGGGKLRI